MSIRPSTRKNIVFARPFPEKDKKEVFNKVFSRIKESLHDISYNNSYEGGFEMPKTDEWIDYLNNHERSNIHSYQYTRQLRFYTDNNNNIIGARCKDGVHHFTDYELDTICHFVNEVLNINISQ